MASDKKPSIYSERSNFGSAEELDEYGVWVKSEPQILSSTGSDEQKAADFDDMALDSESIDDFSSSTFDDIDLPEDDIGGDLSLDTASDDASDTESDDISESIDTDLDDFSIPEDDIADMNLDTSEISADVSEDDTFDIPSDDSIDFSATDISVDTPEDVSEDVSEDASEDVTVNEDEDISFDDDFSISEDEISEDITETASEETGDDIGDIDIDLGEDSFDETTGAVSGEETPEDFSLELSDDDGITDSSFEDVPTVKSINENQDNLNAVEKESSDLSTQLLLKIANELSSIRCELTDLKKEFSIVRSAPHDAAKDEAKDEQHGGFFHEEEDEKIALTGDEMDIILNEDDTANAAGEEQQGGFFSEEDDETIALSGDELDNIMLTADFTEEAGADEVTADDDADISLEDTDFSAEETAVPEEEAAPPEETDDDVVFEEIVDLDDSALFEESAVAEESDSDELVIGDDDFVDIDTDDLDIDISAEDTAEEAAADEPAEEETESDIFEDISTEESEDTVEEASEEISEEDDLSDIDTSADELDLLREEGVTPVTSAPEDTSYLEDDADFDADEFDLSEAVIDEPELTTTDIDEPVTEPALDGMDEADLDIDALEDYVGDDEELPEDDIPAMEDDLDLTSDSDDADVEQVIPEGLEAEIEETPVPFEDDPEGEIAVDDLEELDIEAGNHPGAAQTTVSAKKDFEIPSDLKAELRNVLSYMDQLLESLPDEKIEEFAKSEYFDSYKKLFKELGLV